MFSTYDGRHSIRIGLDPLTVGGSTRRYRNTWEDWCLIPSSRPLVVQPPVNEIYLDIPGMNGQYDLTDSLHNYPTYGMREGSWEFHIAHDRAAELFHVPEDKVWITVYETIANYLHGQGLRCILEDDPYWYYDGRFKINSYKSNKVYSTITIDYKIEPYKWSVTTTLDPSWPWDPFPFTDTVAGRVPTVVEYDDATKLYSVTPKNDIFNGFVIEKGYGFKTTGWGNMQGQIVKPDGTLASTISIPQYYFGSAPVTPIVKYIPSNNTKTAIMHVDNSCTGVFTSLVAPVDGWATGEWKRFYEKRGYHYVLLSGLYDDAPEFVPRKYYDRSGEATGDASVVDHVLYEGINVLPEVQFICPTSDDWVRISFKGYGTVWIDFRQGRL